MTLTQTRPVHRQPVAERDDRSRHVLWSCAIVLVATAVVVLAMLRRTHWHFVYVIDDPAIHLAVAHDLAHHGTWGVSPHDYQSASSSPLWTLLLTPFAWLPLKVFEWIPLIINAAAALWIVRLFISETGVLRPAARRWLDLLAAFALFVGILFLPGLTVVGMEHTLQTALLLQAVVWMQRWLDTSEPRWWRRGLLMIGLATATRFESAFVAAGLIAGLWLICSPRLGPAEPPRPRGQLGRSALLALAAGVPLIGYSAVNLAMHQDILPNSVVAKSALGGGTSGIHLSLVNTLEALAKDPVVLVGALLAVAYLISAWLGGPRRYVVLATAVVTTALLHSALASYGWFERYQAYLVALSVFFALLAARECVPPRLLKAVPVAVIVAAVLLVPVKWSLLTETPVSADNTYLQRYQAALFVQRFYRDIPIATGEVGYIGLYHDGPLLDVLGLANHGVLSARRDHRDTPQYWDAVVRQSGARVIIVYPLSIFYSTPADWILVGQLTLHERVVTAFQPMLQFWAPTVNDVDRIRTQLRQFTAGLPAGVTMDLNPLADITAAQVRAKSHKP